MSFVDRFSGRRAVVTGGASGIGLGVATRLVAEGGSVCLWDLDQDALARATETLGPKSAGIKVNIAEWDEVERATAETAERLGGGSMCWSPVPASPGRTPRYGNIRSTSGGRSSIST